MAEVFDTYLDDDGSLVITKGNRIMTRINIDGDDEEGRILWGMLVNLLPDGYSMPEPLRDGLRYVVYFLGENKITCINDLENTPDSTIMTRILIEVYKQWQNMKGNLNTYNQFPSKNV